MQDKGESKILQTMETSEKTQYTQSSVLHRGQKFISTKADPQFAVAFSISQQDVIDLFQETANALGFEMIQIQEMYATAIKRSAKATFFDLLNCLSWWGQGNRINAVKLTILNNPKSLQSKDKLCRVKSLSDPSIQVQTFIQTFKQKMQKIKGTVPSKYMLESNYEQQSKYANNSNPFHLQACAHYMFHKILTSSTGPQLKIKQHLEQSLKQFSQAFKNIQESSFTLPTPLLNLIGIVKEVCEDIWKCLGGKDKGEYIGLIMPYVRISVEKYVFDRTQAVLKSMEISQKFNKKRSRIIQTMTKQQIFDQVLINKNVRLAQSCQNPNPNRGHIQFCQKSCPQIQKISSISSPREKIKHCNLMYAQLKSFFFSALNMKYELNSMQDIIPVFIVVVLYTEISDLRSQFNLMIDYINGGDEEFEAEKRLLVNLSESFNYIVRDWSIQV